MTTDPNDPVNVQYLKIRNRERELARKNHSSTAKRRKRSAIERASRKRNRRKK